MRQILMSTREEFSSENRVDFFRSSAIKMLAKLIQKSPDEENEEDRVVVLRFSPKKPEKEE